MPKKNLYRERKYRRPSGYKEADAEIARLENEDDWDAMLKTEKDIAKQAAMEDDLEKHERQLKKIARMEALRDRKKMP